MRISRERREKIAEAIRDFCAEADADFELAAGSALATLDIHGEIQRYGLSSSQADLYERSIARMARREEIAS